VAFADADPSMGRGRRFYGREGWRLAGGRRFEAAIGMSMGEPHRDLS
jgi:hypothetical protein